MKKYNDKIIPFDETIDMADIKLLLKDYKRVKDNNSLKDMAKYTTLRYFIIKEDKRKFRLGGNLVQIKQNWVYIQKAKGNIEKVPFDSTIFYVKNQIDNKYIETVESNNELIELFGGEDRFYFKNDEIDPILDKMDFFKPTIELEREIINKFPELMGYQLVNTDIIEVNDTLRTVTLDLMKCNPPGFIVSIDSDYDTGAKKMIQLTSSQGEGDARSYIIWNIQPTKYYLFCKTTLSLIARTHRS